jgi:maltose-binding protein MalE
MSITNSFETNLSLHSNENLQVNDERLISNNSFLNEIYANGKKEIFMPKKFEFGESTKSFSAILNFYENETVFDMRPANKINFKCLICKKVLKAKVGRFTNLNRHIVQDHKDKKQTVEWCTKYNQVNSQSKVGSRLDENMLLLIKYFISSNNSLVELIKKYFKKLMVKAKIKTPNYRTFVNKFLPEVMKQIHEATLSKLNLATSISLITDIWTNKQLKDFIAVAANIINEKFNKELLVIGFTRMP